MCMDGAGEAADQINMLAFALRIFRTIPGNYKLQAEPLQVNLRHIIHSNLPPIGFLLPNSAVIARDSRRV
jgi:hypothetical protein